MIALFGRDERFSFRIELAHLAEIINDISKRIMTPSPCVISLASETPVSIGFPQRGQGPSEQTAAPSHIFKAVIKHAG